MGILGPLYCGIGATIRIGREMLCLPYAEFFVPIQRESRKKSFKSNVTVRESSALQFTRGMPLTPNAIYDNIFYLYKHTAKIFDALHTVSPLTLY